MRNRKEVWGQIIIRAGKLATSPGAEIINRLNNNHDGNLGYVSYCNDILKFIFQHFQFQIKIL